MIRMPHLLAIGKKKLSKNCNCNHAWLFYVSVRRACARVRRRPHRLGLGPGWHLRVGGGTRAGA